MRVPYFLRGYTEAFEPEVGIATPQLVELRQRRCRPATSLAPAGMRFHGPCQTSTTTMRLAHCTYECI
jgi:hypothetical protein